ncbi:YciI family protein [Pseudonocardia nantongensis]|uniref:YciI family protein n=1 Tax=Pseudonocardia nantongensis TaxID=1181885 RepID=UPI00397BBADA
MTTTFAVMYSYTDDTELREATRPAHREYLNGFTADGTLLAAGAWAPTEAPGGLLVFRAADKSAVQAIVDRDPYTTAGVVSSADIREWVPPLGPVAGALTGGE